MNLYLDTSIAVHALRGTPAAERWFDQVTQQVEDMLVSSRILKTELTRVQRRDGRALEERDLILDHVATIPLTDSILTIAESITEHVKTLDAIHLASALALGGDTTVVTHDANLMQVAATLGLRMLDPLAAGPLRQ